MKSVFHTDYELRLRIVTGGDHPLPVREVGTFLKAVNKLYDFCRVVNWPDEPEEKFSQFRDDYGWPLSPMFRLYVVKIKYESPFELVTVAGLSVAALGAMGGLAAKIISVQKELADFTLTAAKIATEALAQEKLKAEIRHLEAQTRQLEGERSPDLRATPTQLVEDTKTLEKVCRLHLSEANRREANSILVDTLMEIVHTRIRISEADISIHKSSDVH